MTTAHDPAAPGSAPPPPAEPIAPAPDSPRRVALACLAALIVGAGFRVWLASNARLVDPFDIGLFMKWTRGLGELGLQGFYEKGDFCDYPPFSVLILHAIGKLGAAFELLGSRDTLVPLIKAPALLADLLVAVALFLQGRRLFGLRGGAAAGMIYFLNPIALYDSAYWGQVDAIHTAFLLFSLVLIGRARWAGAGAAGMLALLTKFQSIAVVPLLIFEVYRLGAWRGLLKACVGAVVVAAAVLAPFAVVGQLVEVIGRSYVRVVGQYDELAKGAFNVWHVVSDAPASTDTAVPEALVRAAARGRASVPADSEWLLSLNYRRISVIAYALTVAMVLSLYSLRPGPVARFAAGGALALAFFLVPTEMHERYAFPAVALLAIWAVSSPARERVYWLFSMLLLLNLAAVLSPAAVAPQIGMGLVLILLAACWTLLQGAPRLPTPPPQPADPATPAGWSPSLIPAFRWATVTMFAAVAGLSAYAVHLGASAPPLPTEEGAVYLSALRPRESRQDWRKLGVDRAATGGLLRSGPTVYFRGLGTHANARHVYDVPAGATRFVARVGVGPAARGKGSAIAAVEVDGVRVFQSDVLRSGSALVDVSVPLSGAARLALITEGAGDSIKSDHLDWLLARFELARASEAEIPATLPSAPERP